MSVVDRVAHAADARRHHGHAEHLRLEQHIGRALGARHEEHDIRGREHRGRIAARAEHGESVAERRRQRSDLVAQRTVAGKRERRARIRGAHGARGLREEDRPLFLGEPQHADDKPSALADERGA